LLEGGTRDITLDLGASGTVGKPLTQYGPGDVTGLAEGTIVRTVPRDGTTDFEPNLFPVVELAHPALPWLLSPTGAQPLPWIVLVVVELRAGVTLRVGPRGRPTLAIAAPARPRDILPDLAESSTWAHAQIAGVVGGAIDISALATNPANARARLLSLRRLAPNTAYVACVVPAFAAGVAAGLEGRATRADGPAWTGDEVSIELPVYHSWRFSTGDVGDFAALAKRLVPSDLDKSVGHRTVDISQPGWGAPAAPGATVEVGGALVSSKWHPPILSSLAQEVGAAIEKQLDAAAFPEPDQPAVFAPPYYGAAATRAGRVATAPAWQRTLVTDVRQRMAAGLGARVVRTNLDAFVDAAWRAVGDTEQINALVYRAELAAVVTQRLADKHLAPLASDGEVVAIARPLLRRLRGADSQVTVATAVRTSALPTAVLAPSFRRLQREGRAIRRSPSMVGTMVEAIDVGRMTPAPPKLLAAQAASFDQISIVTLSTARLAIATNEVIATAAVRWKAETRSNPHAAVPTHHTPATHATATHVPRHADVLVGAPPLASERTLLHAHIDEFAAAARVHQRYIVDRLSRVSDAPQPLGVAGQPRPLAGLRAEIAAQWTAERGILPILASRVSGASVDAKFAPVRVRPVLARPLIDAMQALSPDLVMPKVTALDNNRVAIAAVDHSFVRAFLVGANEELARELQWRRYPAALGHTWLRTFWGRTVVGADGKAQAVPDIPAIEEWPPAGPAEPPAQLVLLARGDVLRRYPNALVYAVEAAWQGTSRVVGTGAPLFPVVTTRLGGDIGLFGFELSLEQARGTDAPPGRPGWYFVIAEHPHEPHFGFAATPTTTLKVWRDIAWSDVIPDLAGDYVRLDGPLASRTFASEPTLHWGTDPAQVASITLRRTTRVAIHASKLL
jgi:hypothetical protein